MKLFFKNFLKKVVYIVMVSTNNVNNNKTNVKFLSFKINLFFVCNPILLLLFIMHK